MISARDALMLKATVMDTDLTDSENYDRRRTD